MMMMDLTFEECVSSTSSTSSIGNSKLFQMLDDDLSSIPCSASSSGSSSNSSTRLDDNMILSSFPSSPMSLENHHHHHHHHQQPTPHHHHHGSASNLTPSFDFDYKGDEFNQQFEFIDDLFLLNSDTCLSANHHDQPNENNINHTSNSNSSSNNNNTSSPGNNNNNHHANTYSTGNNNRCCNNSCCVNNRRAYCCNNHLENSLNSSFSSNFSSSLSSSSTSLSPHHHHHHHTSNINNQHVGHITSSNNNNSNSSSHTPLSASSSLSSNEFDNHLMMEKCNRNNESASSSTDSSSSSSSSPSLLVSYLNNPINHHRNCCKNQILCSSSNSNNNTQIKMEDLPTTSSTPSSSSVSSSSATTNSSSNNIFQVVNPTEINQRTFMMPIKTEPLLCDSKARSHQLDDAGGGGGGGGINTANNSITKIVTSTSSCNKKIINLKSFKSDPRAMRNNNNGGSGSGGGSLCYSSESIKRCKLGPSLLTNSSHQNHHQQQHQLESFQNVIKVIKQESNSQDMSSIGNTQCFDNNSEDHGVCSTKKKMFKTCNGGATAAASAASSVLFSTISQNTPNGDSLFSSTIVNNKSKINVIKITPSLKENSNISGSINKDTSLALLNGLSSSATSKTHTSSGFLSDANNRHHHHNHHHHQQTGGVNNNNSFSALNGLSSISSSSYANVNSPSNKIYPKPSFSYSCLIAMAMRNCDTGHLPVNDIYEFIVENFPYYKTARDGWKNSIRHNLSLNKCFRKIENPISGSKKGCLWALNPEKSRKLEEECRRCIQRDLVNIRVSMKRPDELGDIERGEQRLAKKIGVMGCNGGVGGGGSNGGSTNTSATSSGASSLTASPKCASPVSLLHQHQLPPMSRIIENGVLKFSSNSSSIGSNNSISFNSNSGDFLSHQQDVKFDR